MLSKNQRLTHHDFLIAKREGKTFHFPYLNLIVSQPIAINQKLLITRYAVVTSSKLHKNAVVRNRLRRQIYSLLPQLRQPADVILFPRPSMLNLSYEEISTQLHSALSKISLL